MPWLASPGRVRSVLDPSLAQPDAAYTAYLPHGSHRRPLCSKMQPLCSQMQPLSSHMQPLSSHMASMGPTGTPLAANIGLQYWHSKLAFNIGRQR